MSRRAKGLRPIPQKELKKLSVIVTNRNLTVKYTIDISPFATLKGLYNFISKYNEEFYKDDAYKFYFSYGNDIIYEHKKNSFYMEIPFCFLPERTVKISNMGNREKDVIMYFECFKEKIKVPSYDRLDEYMNTVERSIFNEDNGKYTNARYDMRIHFPCIDDMMCPVYEREMFKDEEVEHWYYVATGDKKKTNKIATQYYDDKIQKMATNYDDPHFAYCNVCYDRNVCFRIDRNRKLEKYNYISTLCCEQCKEHVIKHINEPVKVYYYI